MSNLSLNTHSLYKNKADGELVCLLHYNPMALCSCMICGSFKDNAFNITSTGLIAVDDIISMRNSGNFEELPQLSKDILMQLANAIGPLMPDSEKQIFEEWKKGI